ncbi:MAG: glycosyltransferase [Ferruginibacter sp.]|nr:glycosyltransferase [Ferruginibacter sp.]
MNNTADSNSPSLSNSDSGNKKKIYFTVTTDLSYDQRMIRICTSLSEAGYEIVLVGRKLNSSIPITLQPFHQQRITCFFEKGKLFYTEYNFRLFFYLLFKKMDCICAIDLDTILPCYFISVIKKLQRVYDAHELFCEMKEIVTRPLIYKTWKMIERFTVPKFTHGYTVNQPIADAFRKMYGVNYRVIRNIALLRPLVSVEKKEKFILYQGAVNEGRCFEALIPAMNTVNARLLVCGDGNYMSQLRELVTQNQLEKKVILLGKLPPAELRKITSEAYIGLTLFDRQGLSNYYSLANRFFDYLHAGIPQVCVDFPVYRQLNEELPVAVLVNDTSAKNLAVELNNLLENEFLYNTLQQNCVQARKQYNWQEEEKALIAFYKNLTLTDNN